MKINILKTRTRTVIDFTGSGYEHLVTLGKYNYNKAEAHLEDHVHTNMIEICYYDKGSQWFSVSGKKYLVRGGEVFIHYPGEVHGSGGFPEAKGCLYWFIIRYKKTKGAANPNDTMPFLISELIRLQKRHFRTGPITKKMLEAVFDAAKAGSDKGHLKRIRIKLLAQSLFLTLIESATKSNTDTDNERLQKIYDLVESQLSEHISIPVLAKEANLSESRFKNWFKELSGLTPMDYVQRRRVEYAVKIIKEDPSISFKDIAYELNFSSPQYFTTVVKKFTGKSPGELRS